MTAIFAVAWLVTMFLLACSLIGGYAIRDDLRRDIHGKAATIRQQATSLAAVKREGEAWRQLALRRSSLRSVADAPAHASIIDLLARNEARRFDPDDAEWGDGA